MVQHFDLTLNGTAQQLSDVLTGADDTPLLEIHLEGDDGNSDPVFGGGDNTVSATSYGFRVPGARGAEPLTESRVLRGVKLRLGAVWVFGTDAEILHILVVRQ